MSAELSDIQRTILRAVCDTFVPSLKVAGDPNGFWARSASDIGVDRVLAQRLAALPDALRGGLLGLLDALAAKGFVKAPQERREAILAEIARSSPAAGQGVAFYEKQTLLLNYGLPEGPVPDPNLVIYGSESQLGRGSTQGQNPNWRTMGYPGPASIPHPNDPDVYFQTVVPPGDRLTL